MIARVSRFAKAFFFGLPTYANTCKYWVSMGIVVIGLGAWGGGYFGGVFFLLGYGVISEGIQEGGCFFCKMFIYLSMDGSFELSFLTQTRFQRPL